MVFAEDIGAIDIYDRTNHRSRFSIGADELDTAAKLSGLA